MSSLLPASLDNERCGKHGWWLLLICTALLYLPGLDVLPMMDRDEPRFAHATVEMMQRDSWVIPYFNNEYRFDKPPLTYWWMRLHYSLFGINELAARLHSVIATWLVSLVIVSIGKRLSSARAGLAGGFAWLLTLQVLVHGRLCVADMPMVFFVALSFRALLELLLRRADGFTRWHWLLYISLGLGFLAKGPIAWLVPALALGLHRFVFWRRPLNGSPLRIGTGMFITLAIAASWGIPALVQTHGLFWKVGMGEHVISRGTTAFNGRFPIPGFYLASALLSLFPWIALAPQYGRTIRRQWNMSTALLASWLVAPYLIFTCYATQLPHYVMPGFPAAMVLIAITPPAFDGPSWHKWWSRFVVMLFIGLAFVATSLGIFSALPQGLGKVLLHGGIFLAALAWLGVLVVRKAGAEPTAFPLSLAIVLLIIPTTLTLVAHDLRAIHPAAQLSAKLGPMPATSKLIAFDYVEPSLVFHFNHQWKFTSKVESLEKMELKNAPTVTLLLRREWSIPALVRQSNPERDNSKEVDTFAGKHADRRTLTTMGFNAARSTWVELVVLVQ